MERRVAIVGAGYISDSHLEALKAVPQAKVVAIVDSNRGRAEKLARNWSIGRVLESTEQLLAEKIADVAHVLVPPDLHRAVAEPLLRAGLHVLLEKPLGVSTAECAALNEAANAGKAMLGVNQNFVHLPALRRAKAALAARRIGPLRHVMCWYNMPIRQIAARQFGHWMFRLPQNILLEQAVHPLSQVVDLIGTPTRVDTTIGPALSIGVDSNFYPNWTVTLAGAQAGAQVFFGFGREFPAWGLLLIGDDGAIEIDALGDRMTVQEKSKWPDFYDTFLNGWRPGGQMRRQSLTGLGNYVLSMLKLRPRSDTFIQTMRGSMRSYYDGLDGGRLTLDGAFGAGLVALCETMAAPVLIPPTPRAAPAPVPEGEAEDVTLLGGTGFIGQHTVTALLAAGRKVRVMARNTTPVSAVLADPRVTLIAGDTGRREDVARAIGNSKYVIDLAHGGGGQTYADIERALVGGMRIVAETCVAKGVKRLVYASTIAALYLGQPGERIGGETGTDPQSETRADYARAKAVAEAELKRMKRDGGPSVVIVRPGVVVGEGGAPFHSGLGLFNRDAHCLGWNRGDNPLPFVLVEDCASALVAALTAEVPDGKAYNLVGDVRLTARDYVRELADALGRPIRFHPQAPQYIQAVELAKWLVKRAIGRNVPMPSYRDVLSRGMTATFDCSDAKRDLGWQPVADRGRFVERAIKVAAGGG